MDNLKNYTVIYLPNGKQALLRKGEIIRFQNGTPVDLIDPESLDLPRCYACGKKDIGCRHPSWEF